MNTAGQNETKGEHQTSRQAENGNNDESKKADDIWWEHTGSRASGLPWLDGTLCTTGSHLCLCQIPRGSINVIIIQSQYCKIKSIKRTTKKKCKSSTTIICIRYNVVSI